MASSTIVILSEAKDPNPFGHGCFALLSMTLKFPPPLRGRVRVGGKLRL